MTNLNAINRHDFCWCMKNSSIIKKKPWIFGYLFFFWNTFCFVYLLNDWLHIFHIHLLLIKHQSFVSVWKHRIMCVMLLIMSYFNNESQLYWHCCHFTLGSMRGKERLKKKRAKKSTYCSMNFSIHIWHITVQPRIRVGCKMREVVTFLLAQRKPKLSIPQCQ